MNLKDFAYVTIIAFIPSKEREYIIFYINYKFGQINNTFSSFHIYTTIMIIFKIKKFCKGDHKHNVFNLQILLFQKKINSSFKTYHWDFLKILKETCTCIIKNLLVQLFNTQFYKSQEQLYIFEGTIHETFTTKKAAIFDR